MPASRTLSLLSQGSKHYLTVAISLLTVLPLLCLLFIFWCRLYAVDAHPEWLQALVAAMGLGFGWSGYSLLRRYPRNIVHLRRYLHDITAGELPASIRLEDLEDDFDAIRRYMNTVVGQMRARVVALEEQLARAHRMQQTIRLQAEELVAAERQRVMIESLAAACHHIGQPATVLRVQMELLRRASADAGASENLARCEKALDELAGVLDKLRGVCEYRTVPYRTYGDGDEDADGPRIVDIRDGLSQETPLA
jgi:methyl-accepting chemotaxis protein